jgi:DNA replication and repair protein RecF
MAAQGLLLGVAYRPGGSLDEAEFSSRLAEARAADLRRGSATFGPQKDELELSISGRSARYHASQGQQRILTLALKLAELDCIRFARAVEPILLLDDVSSELDPTRTGAVYESLRESASQVFVTTTRPELFTTQGLGVAERADFEIRGGVLGGVRDR